MGYLTQRGDLGGVVCHQCGEHAGVVLGVDDTVRPLVDVHLDKVDRAVAVDVGRRGVVAEVPVSTQERIRGHRSKLAAPVVEVDHRRVAADVAPPTAP